MIFVLKEIKKTHERASEGTGRVVEGVGDANTRFLCLCVTQGAGTRAAWAASVRRRRVFFIVDFAIDADGDHCRVFCAQAPERLANAEMCDLL